MVGNSTTAEPRTHAFLYDGTTMVNLASGTRAIWSNAREINELGQVVGSRLLRNQYPVAVLWTNAGGEIDEKKLAGAYSEAWTINDNPNGVQAAGFTVGGAQHATLWALD